MKFLFFNTFSKSRPVGEDKLEGTFECRSLSRRTGRGGGGDHENPLDRDDAAFMCKHVCAQNSAGANTCEGLLNASEGVLHGGGGSVTLGFHVN